MKDIKARNITNKERLPESIIKDKRKVFRVS